MQLETQTLDHLVRQRIAITLLGALHGQVSQIVGLELDAIEFIVTAQLFDLLASLFIAHDHLTILIARKLLKKFLFADAGTVLLLGTEIGRNGKVRHDRGVVNRVGLHLIADLQRIGHRLRIGRAKDGLHLGRCLHPLLLGVEHTFRVVQILTRREADQAVVCLGMLLIDKVDIVRTNRLDLELLGQLAQGLIDLELHAVGFMVSTLDCRFVQLQLQIVILSKDLLIPAHGLLGTLHILLQNTTRNLATQAGRTADQPLMVAFQLVAVRTRTHVIAIRPRLGDNLDQIFIPRQVLRQQDQVPTTHILLMALVAQRQIATASHIDFATDDRFEIGHRLQFGDFLTRHCRIERKLLLHGHHIINMALGLRVGLRLLG